MKAIIPVAGIGSRLRPHTKTQPKSLIPVAGKPILGHILDRLVGEGIEDFCLSLAIWGIELSNMFARITAIAKRSSLCKRWAKESVMPFGWEENTFRRESL